MKKYYFPYKEEERFAQKVDKFLKWFFRIQAILLAISLTCIYFKWMILGLVASALGVIGMCGAALLLIIMLIMDDM